MRVWIFEHVHDPGGYEEDTERLGVYSSKTAARPDFVSYARKHAYDDDYVRELSDDELIDQAGRPASKHEDGSLSIMAGGSELRLVPEQVITGRRKNTQAA